MTAYILKLTGWTVYRSSVSLPVWIKIYATYAHRKTSLCKLLDVDGEYSKYSIDQSRDADDDAGKSRSSIQLTLILYWPITAQ